MRPIEVEPFQVPIYLFSKPELERLHQMIENDVPSEGVIDSDPLEDTEDFIEDDDCLPEHREDGTDQYVRHSEDSDRMPPV